MMRQRLSILGWLAAFALPAIFAPPAAVSAQVIWEQDWDSSPDWRSPLNQDASGLAATHASAVAVFNVSGYRHNPYPFHIVEISQVASRTAGGKGLIYRMTGTGTWEAASLDLAFSDPDVKWATSSIDRTGYSEIWYRLWMRQPVALNYGTSGYQLWKAARFYAYDVGDYLGRADSLSDASSHWAKLVASNESLSSHYLSGSLYKKPYFIPSWYGPTLYLYPQWQREQDADGGTSSYAHTNDRDNYSTHLLRGVNWWSGGNATVAGALGDNGWHCVEYHVKLNDVGVANDVQEVYLDGGQRPVSTVGNGKQLRQSTRKKIHHIILFDNYSKEGGTGTQDLYIDDLVISTSRVGCGTFSVRAPQNVTIR